MKAPKPAPLPPVIAIPKPTMDSMREKKKIELQRLQAGSGRASTIFTDLTSPVTKAPIAKSQKTGG